MGLKSSSDKEGGYGDKKFRAQGMFSIPVRW
jgi:hypothetical protein